MNDLVFIPIKEELDSFAGQKYYCEFKLNFLSIVIAMFDIDILRHYKPINVSSQIKRYVIVLDIDHNQWVFYTNDNENAAYEMYKACTYTLKTGDTWEFKDISQYKRKPIRINWQSIRFEW